MTSPTRIDRLRTGSAKVGCLLNPNSGQVRKRSAAIRQVLTSMPDMLVCEASDMDTFQSAMECLLQADTDLLVIVAGDGTTHAVLGHLFRILPVSNWPVLMIVPGGTTNMTPLDLGMRGKPEHILRRLRSVLVKPEALQLRQRPVLRIEQPGMDTLYGMFFAVGLVARGVKFSRSSVKQLGITGGIFTFLIMLRSLVGMISGMITGRQHDEWAPVTLTMTQGNGHVNQGTYLFALISALDCLLLNMRPYWGQEPAPLHVTWVDQHPRHLWRSLWPLLTGNGQALLEQDGYHSHNIQSLTLHLDDEYIVDGELYRSLGPNIPLQVSATDLVTFLVL